MMGKVNGRGIVVGAMLLLGVLLLGGVSFAQTDVTEKIQLNRSRMIYNRRAGTTSFDVSLTNISGDVLLTPIRVVIEDISDPNVSVSNPDGFTDEGEPYFSYDFSSGLLAPQEQTNFKRWTFLNPNRVRFSYSIKVLAKRPMAACRIGPSGGHLEVTDFSSSLYGTAIDVPEGAVSYDTYFAIGTLDDHPPLPSWLGGVELGVDFRCSVGAFAKDVVITMRYDPANMTHSSAPVVLWYDRSTSSWKKEGAVHLDQQNSEIRVAVTHFSARVLGFFSADLDKEVDCGFLAPEDLFVEDDRNLHTSSCEHDFSAEGWCAGIALYTYWFFAEKSGSGKSHGLLYYYNQDPSESLSDGTLIYNFPTETERMIACEAQVEGNTRKYSFHYFYIHNDWLTSRYLWLDLNQGKPGLLVLSDFAKTRPHMLVVVRWKKPFFYVVDSGYSRLELRKLKYEDGSFEDYHYGLAITYNRFEYKSFNSEQEMRAIYKKYNHPIDESGLGVVDYDGDGILPDGDSDGTEGDFPCTAIRASNCDDNCPFSFNPDQADSDADGIGDACEKFSEVTDGLKVYYSFDNFEAGDTMIADDSGNQNDLTRIKGHPEPVAGVSGSGIRFNGVDDYVYEYTEGFKFQELTVTFWYKHVERSTETIKDHAELLFHATGGYSAKIRNVSKTLDVVYNVEPSLYGYWYCYKPFVDYLNRWTFVAITFKDGVFTTYLNAANPKTHVHEKGKLIPQTSDGLWLGGFSNQNKFNGVIDEFRLYDRILSESEIQKLYSLR